VQAGPGRYEEEITVPDGVVLRSTDGPRQTVVAVPTTLGDAPALVSLAPGRRRSGFAGFTVQGAVELPLDPLAPPWTGLRVERGIASADGFRGFVTGNLVYWWETGISLEAMTGAGSRPWVGGNTVVRCRTGIRVSAHEGSSIPILLSDPCAGPAPLLSPTGPVLDMPILEHNVVTDHLTNGLYVEAGRALPATRAAFNDFFRNQSHIVGLVQEAVNLDDNALADPVYLDGMQEDFRPSGQTTSPVLAANAKDGRFRGALSDG
jgi:hypothetical protein